MNLWNTYIGNQVYIEKPTLLEIFRSDLMIYIRVTIRIRTNIT